MKKIKTYVAIVLDKSGSMETTKTSTISGFNELIQQLKEDSKEQDIFCSLVTFNGEVYEHLWNESADNLSQANADDYQPIGSTSLRDAIGYTVQKLLNTTDPNDPDVAYRVDVISDGESNSDRHVSWDALKELTKGCEDSKKWTFNYLGCTKQYLEQLSKLTGTARSNFAAWDNSNPIGAEVGFKNAVLRSKKYMGERLMGACASSNYASDDDSVADFCSLQDESAPAPVICATNDLNVGQVLNSCPKYVNQTNVSYNASQGLFANAVQVTWENK